MSLKELDLDSFDKELLQRIVNNYARMRDLPNSSVTVTKVHEGYGRHVCDGLCKKDCWAHYDDSDYIVTLSCEGYEVVYGVLNGQINLWAD